MAWPLGSDGGGEEVSAAVASKARFDRPILLRGQIKHSGLRVELICGVGTDFYLGAVDISFCGRWLARLMT